MKVSNTFATMVLVLWSQRAVQAFTSKASRAAATSHSRPGTEIPRLRTLMSATAAPEDTTETTATESGGDAPQKLPDMDEIVSLCKRRGIIFPSSEIYNGYAGFFDYGPLGAELKKNLKDAWWKHFVTQREDVVGLDSSIIHNPTTWKSSGRWDTMHRVSVDDGIRTVSSFL